MGRAALFRRLIVRPLFQDFLRTLLTTTAVALGVAVVLAITLASQAAVGSFRSSIESLMGDADLEVVAGGGVPEAVVGTLARLPYPIEVRPRVEGFAWAADLSRTLPVIGLDLVSDATANRTWVAAGSDDSRDFANLDGVWLSSDLERASDDHITLRINDHTREYLVRGEFGAAPDGGGLVVMDLAAAQREFGRYGQVDRIHLAVPDEPSMDEWKMRLRAALPDGVEVRPAGSQTDENRRMLAAFRLNLRMLSYISLIVGAFLIYNTISVSVVRRRPEIGIVRALGASRRAVLAAFLGEAACLGLVGGVLGCLVGRIMATGALRFIAATVDALYVTSRPAPIELTWVSWLYALAMGITLSVAAALSPAREAALVSPLEAMGRGQREFAARTHQRRHLGVALALAVCGIAAAFAPPVARMPLFGYAAALLLVGASAFAIPAAAAAATAASSRALRSLLGVEALLAARSMIGSLRRTSVLVGALSTAIAMMVAVGIMVGSFRETVRIWLENRLEADFYLRPAGPGGPGQHPTMDADLPERLQKLPGVAAVDRYRAYDISYQGLPATLAWFDVRAAQDYRRLTFLSGRPAADVYRRLLDTDSAIISEPFANKHRLRAGDSVSLPLRGERREFRIVDVYFDYGSEAGYVLMDRGTLMKYLPDPAPSNIAVYLAPGSNPGTLRAEIERAAAESTVVVASNSALRSEAMRVFDRTFVITYALEAVSMAVAVIGIAGALLALVVDRRREFELARFLGAARRQIRKWILIEAGLIGLLASFAGLLLGFALSLILIYVVNKQSFGWTIRFHWPVAVLLVSTTVVYLATLAAGLYPARTAMRLDPIEVVHEE